MRPHRPLRCPCQFRGHTRQPRQPSHSLPLYASFRVYRDICSSERTYVGITRGQYRNAGTR